LDEADLSLLRQYVFKVEEHITERAFAKLARTFPYNSHSSLKVIKKHVQFLSGFQPVQYSCCINSCICFTGPYETLSECPKCHEAKLNAKSKPRKSFDYIPIIPRLRAMLGNHQHAEKMSYRAKFMHEPGTMTDIFDAFHYRSLLDKIVPTSRFFYFSDPRDVALGLSTDGFTPFKRRDKTC
ncbi:hypothetical protein AGABI2DRAFT_44711, partial [Agaricus bisporus var. bisporus H97]|uniref:hypothetical protein n=1 Tax=Agaricus bisporus var. bisporus (strain H97 / ATCC MYA-4626 / FGSC 10389) TaxID=936046 RepID=UPI00029F530D